MEIKDITTSIGFIGGRDAIIIEYINIINPQTIEVYVNVSHNSLCNFVDNTVSDFNLRFVFNGVMKFQLYDYEMFESNIKGKGQTVSSIREIVNPTFSKKGLHHILIIAYDNVMEFLCTEFHDELITANKQQTD
ncbi:hypothetical protein B5F34_02975 [Mediterranea sp. An20]|uniref:hypothetical protein n=1 Tax=Bacteroidaceae TaxID=815 RepID=UPI000B39DA7F|nr:MULTISPECIES: hypothetical protein [Bacteroidaceae]MCL1616419.1 hypothetical protein [Bacteroides sp. ET71]OUP11479.1 hypothetical protein B5F34_02975 [Mediterranea sp. An20]